MNYLRRISDQRGASSIIINHLSLPTDTDNTAYASPFGVSDWIPLMIANGIVASMTMLTTNTNMTWSSAAYEFFEISLSLFEHSISDTLIKSIRIPPSFLLVWLLGNAVIINVYKSV